MISAEGNGKPPVLREPAVFYPHPPSQKIMGIPDGKLIRSSVLGMFTNMFKSLMIPRSELFMGPTPVGEGAYSQIFLIMFLTVWGDVVRYLKYDFSIIVLQSREEICRPTSVKKFFLQLKNA